MKILIFGLPGSGKSTLAEPLANLLNGVWINADQIRTLYDDWDFSIEGRRRQATRMQAIATGVEFAGKIPVIDFICPTKEFREIINSEYAVWMDTIGKSEYTDTNEMFEIPDLNNVDYHVSEWFDDTHQQLVEVLKEYILRREAA